MLYTQGRTRARTGPCRAPGQELGDTTISQPIGIMETALCRHLSAAQEGNADTGPGARGRVRIRQHPSSRSVLKLSSIAQRVGVQLTLEPYCNEAWVLLVIFCLFLTL